MAEKEKKLKVEKILTAFLIAMVVFCGSITIQVVMKGYASFGGYSFFRVVTGSMEPEIPTGALLVCKDVDIKYIEAGDIVCFKSKDRYMEGSIITHRVYDIKLDNNGEINLITKGDANIAIDGYTTTAKNFVGKVTWFTAEDSFFINIVKFLSKPTGFMACVVFPVLLTSSMVLKECTKSIMKDLEEASAEMDQLEEIRAEEIEKPDISDEEYQEMYERIKKELLEELGLNRDEREG